jgi:EAL domain-containing protein (putative c-di-GMP-specific phosphodiesterase class I)
VLARLVGRDGELVAPGRFMPAVERFGLSPDFDIHVLRRAAALAGAGRPLSVNLSARSIGVPRVLDALATAVAEHDVAPGTLTVELTETALGSDVGSFVAFGEAITATGCRLALDDFGTGYGTLTYLATLPVDVIKIDRSFVSRLGEDAACADIVASIAGLARRLGKLTVAEGVEQIAELEALRTLGVDRVQGFLLGRPQRMGDTPRVGERHYTS